MGLNTESQQHNDHTAVATPAPYQGFMGMETSVDNATSYSRNNSFNQWMAQYGNGVFFTAQLLGNISLLTYAVIQGDNLTAGTATNNIIRNLYGGYKTFFAPNEGAKNEARDANLMLWGAGSNSLQAFSFLDEGSAANSVAGGLATTTYLIRFAAPHVRINNRNKEKQATQKLTELNRQEAAKPNDIQENTKDILNQRHKTKQWRRTSYGAEKTAAGVFLGRGLTQLIDGITSGNIFSTIAGGLFTFGAGGMMKKDMVKSKNGRERCFYANAEQACTRIESGRAVDHQPVIPPHKPQ